MRKNLFLKCGGFTLIEMMIAMTVFAIFIASLAGSYLTLTRAQRDTNEMRKLYSQGRLLMDEITEKLTAGAIDYDCFDIATNECGGSTDVISSSITTQTIRILLGEGKRYTLRASPCNETSESCYTLQKFVEVYDENTDVYLPSQEDGFETSIAGVGYQNITMDGVQISDVDFVLSSEDDTKAPYISIYIMLSYVNRVGAVIEYPVQTTVSLTYLGAQ